MKALFALCLLSASAMAGTPVVDRDLAYTESKAWRQTLDVYRPASGANHPVVIWIHGGGWQFGSKRYVQHKPTTVVDRDMVFVAINYRLSPSVGMGEIASDIARAIAWVHANGEKYGCDTDRLIVAGHSAGAHLAALVCTDEQYLQAAGLALANVKGCICVDTAAFDAKKLIADLGQQRSSLYIAAFGEDAGEQRKFSPIAYVERDKNIPPFLLLHLAQRHDSASQSRAFAAALRKVGVEATIHAANGKSHLSINRDLGKPGDRPTEAIFRFLDQKVGEKR